MNKLLATLLASTFALIASTSTNAATVGGNFNVTVTLNSVCTMGTISNLAFGTYTAFQATAATATATSATLTCTRGLTGVTAEFDTGTDKSSGAAATNATGAGVVAGLNYTITATAGTVTAGTAATTSSIGTADSRAYSITGSMPANQAGTCTTTSCAGSQTRTLTINY